MLMSVAVAVAFNSVAMLPSQGGAGCGSRSNVTCVQYKVTGGAGGGGGRGGAQVVYCVHANSCVLGGPTGGAGGSGGNGNNNAAAPAAPTVYSVSTTHRILKRCELTISSQVVVDDQDCDFQRTGNKFAIQAKSANLKYTYQIAMEVDPDKQGAQGTLTGGRSSKPRDLGRMTPSGACWNSVDSSVRVCAWSK